MVIKIKWSANFAYGIGLLATDGNLSKDGRHITFTSKDYEQVQNFQKAFGVKISVRQNWNGSKNSQTYRCQFSDVNFYKFLLEIGLTPAKSKTLKTVKVPSKFFFDFLRGNLDGDGSFYSYKDKRWKSSFMYYLSFSSASRDYLNWLSDEIQNKLDVVGHITNSHRTSCMQLKYAKAGTRKLVKKIYTQSGICLSRKRLKILKTIGKIG